jgi:uncharacterized membrane protein
MNLETTKNLGGVGAILIAIGGLATFAQVYGGLLSLIGIILVFIAAKGLADHYGEAGILNNALYALVIVIVGAIASAGIAIYGVFTQIFSTFHVTEGDWAGLSSAIQQSITSGDISWLWNLIGTLILAWVVLSIFVIIATVLARKSLNLASAKTGVGMFGTAGILALVGGILFIVFVGVILIWIAWILIAVGFFSIRTTAPQPTAPTQPAT